MKRRYYGGLISATQTAVNTSSASGIFSTNQQMQAKQAGAWPSVLPLPPVYNLYAWGDGGNGQLGRNNTTSISSPQQVGSDKLWSVVDVGYLSSQSIRLDGTLWVWGLNSYYQLGLGDNTNRSSPVQVGTDTNWSKIASGGDHRLAIKTTGSLWAWGENNHGAQGTGFTFDNAYPVQIGTDTNWAEISAGGGFSAAIKTNGTLWTWGLNSYGQLGIGNTSQYYSPKQVGALTDWYKISCSAWFHCAAIKTDGTLWTWGKGNFGRLGLGNTTYYSSPKQVGALTNWAKVISGSDMTQAIKTDGTLWSWGYGTYGGLGLGDIAHRSSPTQVGALTDWANIGTGLYRHHCVGVKTDGTLWTWGFNSNGQLGLNTSGNYARRSSPSQVGALTNWVNAASGYRHTIALVS
jgi:alpha-tubulin suppressor-like RCC1 family protein